MGNGNDRHEQIVIENAQYHAIQNAMATVRAARVAYQRSKMELDEAQNRAAETSKVLFRATVDLHDVLEDAGFECHASR